MRQFICYYFTKQKLKKAKNLKKIKLQEFVKLIDLFISDLEERVVEVLLRVYIGRLDIDSQKTSLVKEVENCAEIQKLNAFRALHSKRMFTGRSLISSDFKHLVMDIKVSLQMQKHYYTKYKNASKILLNHGIGLTLDEVFLMMSFYSLQRRVFFSMPLNDMKQVLSFICSKASHASDVTRGGLKQKPKKAYYSEWLSFLNNSSTDNSSQKGSLCRFSFEKDFSSKNLEVYSTNDPLE